MQIIPAIDIKDGKCVRLFQGDYNKEIIYDPDPVFVAKKWKIQGATILHIVDLDGAKEGTPKNINVFKKIIEVVDLPIQVGGGIRTYDSIKQLIKSKVTKIILGTIALEDDALLKKAVHEFGEKIIVALDVKDHKLMKRGWLKKSDIDLFLKVKQLELWGVKTVMYTDTTRDGTLTSPNYQDIEKLRTLTKMGLIVAGGITTLSQLKKLNTLQVDAVVLGTALYENRINLQEALKYVG